MSIQPAQQMSSLLARALQLPANDRVAFVRAECPGDDALVEEILSLLVHHEQADAEGFLAGPGSSFESFASAHWLEAADADDSAAYSGTSIELFYQRLRTSGLVSEEDVARATSTGDGQQPTTATEAARQLVGRRKLTLYQADALLRGNAEPLAFGKYVVLDFIAEGGMGRVYKARHRLMNRVVALKFLSRDAVGSESAARRFRREVETAAQLKNPNIVAAYDADEVDGTQVLVMEYIDGVNLARMVRRAGPLPLRQAVDYILQAARGLAYAHRHHIFHRDVKPSNMLVDHDNTLKLLDMGLARFGRPAREAANLTGEDLTREGHFIGTPDYVAPEQAVNDKGADHRADIYSLGCSLHYLLTARPPYCADSATATIIAHREQPVPSLRAARPDVPAQLDTLFQAMLAKQPDDRPQSMDEVVRRLEALLNELPEEELDAHEAEPDYPLVYPDPSGASHTTATLESASTDRKMLPVEPPVPITSVADIPVAPAPRRYVPYIAAALLLLLGPVLLTVVIRILTSDGTLVVTVEKPLEAKDVVIELDGERAVNVEEVEKGRVLRVSVEPGQRKLRVKTADGVELLTEEFSLERGGMKIVNARLEQPRPSPDEGGAGPLATDQPRPPVVSQGSQTTGPAPPPVPPPASTARDYEAAKWVLENRGQVTLWVPGQTNVNVGNMASLPGGAFRLVGFHFGSGNLTITEEVIELLKALPELKAFDTHGVLNGNEVLPHFAENSQLEHLVIHDAQITGHARISNAPFLRRLGLSGNTLDGVTIENCPALEELHLERIGLTDDGIDGIVSLSSLRALNLGNNLITDNGLKRIASLPNLKRLNMDGNTVTDEGLAGLAKRLPQLEELSLVRTGVTDGGLDAVAACANLKALSLDETLITDKGLVSLVKLRDLRSLSLRGTGVRGDGLASLAGLPELHWLALSYSQVTDDGLVHLKGLASLRSLLIDNNSNISDVAMSNLAQMTQLRSVNLNLTPRITDAGIEHLASLDALEGLGLVGTAISDGAVDHLTDFTALRQLDISQTRITQAGYNRLKAALPKCTINWEPPADAPTPPQGATSDPETSTDRDRQAAEWVLQQRGTVRVRLEGGGPLHVTTLSDLPEGAFAVTNVDIPYPHGVGLTNESMQFVRLPELRVLVLSHTGVGDEGLKHLADSAQLRDLELQGASITGSGLQHLISLKRLARLELMGNPVKDLRYLAEIRGLTYVGLSDTSIADDELRHLVKLPGLNGLRISGNPQLSDAAMKHISQMKTLNHLEMNGASITDAAVPELLRLDKLQILQINDTQITEEGFKKLQAGLPNCQIAWSGQ